MRARRAFMTSLLVLSAASSGTAQPGGTYRISSGQVSVACSLTAGGGFEARTTNMTGDVEATDAPGLVSGRVRVDLESLGTGIGLRDRHMRDNYLEVQRGPQFALATLQDIRVDQLDGKTSFSGTLTLHAQRRTITGTAQIQRKDGRLRVDARFPIRLSDFQIASPTYLGIGVRDELEVHVRLAAGLLTPRSTDSRGVPVDRVQ